MLDQAPSPNETLDAGATACGDLVLLIVKHMKALDAGHVLHVIGYDRGAAEDVPAWCRMTGNPLIFQHVPTDPAQPSHFYIQKG